KKKTPADTARLADWLLKNAKGADACVLSLDTLIYGGIVPSRLHHETIETLIARAQTVETLRRENPRMKLYVFQLIMRCPSYSLADEEPDYYDDCGEEIHLYGRYTHLAKLGKLTEEDEAEFARVKKKIPSEALQDFLGRRDKNISVLMHNLEYVKNGVVDYFIIPQDDAAVYGFTSMDQIRVREYLKTNSLHLKTAMYPSADDTGLTLLARAAAELGGVKPKIFVHYASSKGGSVIPWFEDRMVDETVKYHVLAVGGRRVYSLAEADILLAVNVGSGMYYADDPAHVNAYDVERNLAEFVSCIEYALEEGKLVAVGDIASCNGGDEELVKLLQTANLLYRIHAYAGWNTSSNTLGTAVCESVLYLLGKDDAGNRSFLTHRYFEDIGYMAYARKYVTDNLLPQLGLDYFRTDGTDGEAARAVKDALLKYMRENYPAVYGQVAEVSVEMPWRRMFETDVKIKLKEL
ncbi:MAG: DUF4127 family protein, partial [Clostridia bacterium]|nr:DUF4127 family protein [Clostridia bacterium]